MALPGIMQLPEALHLLGMALAIWMRRRGHGWRHGIEMSLGTLLPWAAVLTLVALGSATLLPWLEQAGGPAMFCACSA